MEGERRFAERGDRLGLVEIETEPHLTDPEQRLSDMLSERPSWSDYLTKDSFTKARHAYRKTPGLITGDPQLLEQLQEAYKRYPDHVAMVAIPDAHIILAKTSYGMFSFNPVLTCTSHAARNMTFGLPSSLYYGSYHSENTEDMLVEDVWRMAEEERTPLIYDPNSMAASDYVAIAASGMMFNEVFRRSIKIRDSK